MPLFKYQVYDGHGAKISSEFEANDALQAKQLLKEKGYTLVQLEEVKAKQSGGSLGRKLSLADLEFFTAQLSLLLQNGLRIDACLQLLRKTSSSDQLKLICSYLLEKVRAGQSFSKSLGEIPGFDKVYVSLCSIGEVAGNLPEVLSGLAASLKFKKQLSNKISQAIAYPAMIFLVCILAVVFIFNFVIPRMSALFEGAPELPWYTVALLSTSDFVNQYQWVVFGVIAFVVTALRLSWTRNPEFARKTELFLIDIPFLRNSFALVERIRHAEAMALTLKNGVSLEHAMSLSGDTLKVNAYRTEAFSAREDIKKGSSLFEALSKCSFYDDTFLGLIEVGEQSGSLDIIFDEIARRSREAFDLQVARFTSLLEPILILFMAGIVGSVVIVMLMSIISVQDISL